jgi:hypothetical protein
MQRAAGRRWPALLVDLILANSTGRVEKINRLRSFAGMAAVNFLDTNLCRSRSGGVQKGKGRS